MLGNLKAVPTNLLRSLNQFTQPNRTTFILRRKYPIRLSKLSSLFPKKLKRRAYYYEFVEDLDCKKKAPVKVVLTSDVSGVGMRGEKIELNKYIAYRDLLLPKLAVYEDLPEAQRIMKSTDEKHYSSIYSKIVGNHLANLPVEIILSNDIQWKLKPWHVKFALRRKGILANENCITVPKEISGPNIEIENKDFLVHITMNKSEVFKVRCRIYHWSTVEPLLNQKSYDINSPSEALFPDEKETIDAILKVEQEIRRSSMIRGEKTPKLKEIKK